MILVDSSVWIDVLGNRTTRHTATFEQLLVDRLVVGVGDLIAAEVLQGTRSERDFDDALATLRAFVPIVISSPEIAVQAARNYRALRAKGITVRKTIDVLIATRCIAEDIPLLYADRDFDPFVEHLGLIPAIDAAPGAPR